jgi:hypothetical protein
LVASRSDSTKLKRRIQKMRKGTIVICVVVMLISMCALAFAGGNDSKDAPPNYLNITREMTKPGVGPAHEKLEMGWPQAFTKADWPTHYLAMTSVTGPPEAWFITGYDSAEAAEKDADNFAKNTAAAHHERTAGAANARGSEDGP